MLPAFCLVERPARKTRMKTRHAVSLAHCPNCGARLIPTSKELKRWRILADLTQRQMGACLKLSAAYIAYLENGKRTPSASVIKRYRKFIRR